MQPEDVKNVVRDGYAQLIAEKCTACTLSSFACGLPESPISETGRMMSYTNEDIRSVPKGANLGMGCGNPVALASLQPGERVLDLGSGAGFDAFLAAQRVGPQGRVIGLDITPEMAALARKNAGQGSYSTVEFREGDMEEIPLPDASVDVIISNCSINLAPDKVKTFREAYRVLKPGGRIAVTDIALRAPLPDILLSSSEAYIGCLASAARKDDYLNAMRAAGFSDVTLICESPFPIESFTYEPVARIVRACLSAEETAELNRSIVSIAVAGKKLASP